jgi:hypothetical protein
MRSHRWRLAALGMAALLLCALWGLFDFRAAHSCTGLMPAAGASPLPTGIARVSYSTIYRLSPEPTDMASVCSAYGNPLGRYTFDAATGEDRFDSTGFSLSRNRSSGLVMADHWFGSTVGSIDRAAALRYALDWIDRTGGMPRDAVLTYSGAMIDRRGGWGYVAEPAAIPSGARVIQYLFIWRQKSSPERIYDNRISVNVDDAGHAAGRTWISQPNVPLYVRQWRAIGDPESVFTPVKLPSGFRYRDFMFGGWAKAASQGFCGSESGDESTATPCVEYRIHGLGEPMYRSYVDGLSIRE